MPIDKDLIDAIDPDELDHDPLEEVDDEESDDTDDSDASTEDAATDEEPAADDEEPSEPREGSKKQSKTREHRIRQREFRKQKAIEAKIRIQTLESQNNELSQRMQLLEKRGLEETYNEVDSHLQRAVKAYELADAALAKAEGEDNAMMVAKALDAKRRASDAYQQAYRHKQSLQDQARDAVTKQKTTLTPQAEAYARTWLDRNKGWIEKGGQSVSIAVQAIDTAVINEGYKPDSVAYWQELSRRCRTTFTHLMPQKQNSKIPPRTAGNASNTTKTTSQKIPESFKNNLEEAGFTPGTDQYKRAVANYFEGLKKA